MSKPAQSGKRTGGNPTGAAAFPPPLPFAFSKFIGKDASQIRVIYDEFGHRTEILSLLDEKGEKLPTAAAVWISIDEHKRRRAKSNEESSEEKAEALYRRAEARLGVEIDPKARVLTDAGVKAYLATLSRKSIQLIEKSQKSYQAFLNSSKEAERSSTSSSEVEEKSSTGAGGGVAPSGATSAAASAATSGSNTNPSGGSPPPAGGPRKWTPPKPTEK